MEVLPRMFSLEVRELSIERLPNSHLELNFVRDENGTHYASWATALSVNESHLWSLFHDVS